MHSVLQLVAFVLLAAPFASAQYGMYPGMYGSGLGMGYGGYGMYGGLGGLGGYGGYGGYGGMGTLGMYSPYTNYWCNNYGLYGKKKR